MQFTGNVREELSASVEQIARVLGVPPTSVERPASAQTAREWLSDKEVRDALRDASPRRPLAEAEALITGAFEQAQATQKSEWRDMTLPVLKNRMLSVAGGSFDEADFGCPNLRYFVHEFPDLLEVTVARPHWVVRFLGAEAAVVAAQQPQPRVRSVPTRGRVRPDIWNAAVDYRSGETYVWRMEGGIAEPGEPGEFAPAFPTLTQDDISRWRQEFARELGRDDHVGAIDKWVRVGGTSTMLTPDLRNEWNGYLREQVKKHAEHFFENSGIDVPQDLIVGASRGESKSKTTVDLRAALHAAIDQLSEKELRQISLPAAVLITRAGR